MRFIIILALFWLIVIFNIKRSEKPLKKDKIMTFSEAVAEMLKGNGVTRESWENDKNYCLLVKERLNILVDGEFHSWHISKEDLEATDWKTI